MSSHGPSPLRVLFAARWYPSHDQPGRGTFVADLARALGAAGVDVRVASFDATHVRGVTETRAARQDAAFDVVAGAIGRPEASNRAPRWDGTGVPVARLPVFLDGERRRPNDLIEAHAKALMPFGRAEFGRARFDLIHAHTGLPDGAVAARLADELGLPLVVTEHSSMAAGDLDDPEALAAYASLLEGRRRLVAVSQALASTLTERLGAPSDRIGVLPNAVPVESFPVGAAEGRDPSLLLYVGSRKASKGIETLLQAFAFLAEDRPDLRLRLVGQPGTPEEEARWAALEQELGIDAAVSRVGLAPRSVVAAAMREAAVFVHPSPRETFGMVAAEALASGLPVATTPSGGVDEILGGDGRFGAIAAGHSPEALAAAVEEVLARREFMDADQLRGRVVDLYAAPAIAARTLMLYGRMLAGGAGGSGVPGSGLLTAASPAGASGSGLLTAASPAGASGSGSRVALASAARSHSAASDPGPLPLVLAMARGHAIERIAGLPAELRDRLTIVTSHRGKYADDCDLPARGRWLELDPERFHREAVEAFRERAAKAGGIGRLTAALRGHRLRDQRAAIDARREETRRSGIREFLLDATISSGAREAGTRGWLVCLDADDVLLGRAATDGDGLTLAPGGLRWLADRWAGGAWSTETTLPASGTGADDATIHAAGGDTAAP
ncbi:MAG TPA: glycosyltransferase [Candidatus Saccharimonadales bacterium]|nr:glycosyltransferase [Candidatus Saccharimonadales bacterium]